MTHLLFDKILDWFKNNKPIYIVWVLSVGLLVGGGFNLVSKHIKDSEYLISLGIFIWLIGAIIAFINMFVRKTK